MITTLKLAGMSAVLSAGLVSGFDADAVKPAAPGTAKIYTDRLPEPGNGRIVVAYADAHQPAIVSNVAGKSDRLRYAPEAGDARVAATTTTETRTGSAASTLTRVPASTASR